MMNESLFIGLIVGLIILIGGYGNVGVWGFIFVDKYGVIGVVELVMVCVIFGLVLGGLVGGFVVCYFLKKVFIFKIIE